MHAFPIARNSAVRKSKRIFAQKDINPCAKSELFKKRILIRSLSDMVHSSLPAIFPKHSENRKETNKQICTSISFITLGFFLFKPMILTAADAYTDAQLWTMSKDAKEVKAGSELSQLLCASCHEPGPQNTAYALNPALNLKDNVWYYGGKPTDVFRIISTGIQEKGMVSYDVMVDAAKIAQLTAFILSTHSPQEQVIDGKKAAASAQTTSPSQPATSPQATTPTP